VAAQGGNGGECGHLDGCRTAFSLDPATAAFMIPHSFSGGADGAYPCGDLATEIGRLYGTTLNGAGTGCYEFGCGTAFTLDPATGSE
jgi:hypothetical protein